MKRRESVILEYSTSIFASERKEQFFGGIWRDDPNAPYAKIDDAFLGLIYFTKEQDWKVDLYIGNRSLTFRLPDSDQLTNDVSMNTGDVLTIDYTDGMFNVSVHELNVTIDGICVSRERPAEFTLLTWLFWMIIGICAGALFSVLVNMRHHVGMKSE